MKNYIAILDYEHLENPIFLKSFAQALAKHKNRKGIVVHGDSEYTNRIMQTGVMREEARLRAVKDLNRRLVSLFADYGVPTIGLQAFQKGLVKKENNNKIEVDIKQLQSLPNTPALLISSLVDVSKSETFISPLELALSFQSQLEDYEIVLFSKKTENELFVGKNILDHKKWDNLDNVFIDENLPDEFIDAKVEAILTTSLAFSEWPELKNATYLH